MLGLSLRTKMIVASILVLAPVLVLVVWNYRTTYDLQKNQIVAEQVRVAELVGTMLVDDVFNQAVKMDSSYAENRIIRSFDRMRINDYLAGILPLYPEYDDPLAVFDANGNQTGSARSFSSINVADREWFQDVMRTGEPSVSNMNISRSSGLPIVSVAVPIRDRDGKPLGAVSSAVNPDQFLRPVMLTPRRPGQEIFLTDRKGRLVFHTGKPELTWEERDVSAYAPVRMALEGKRFVGDQVDSLIGDHRIAVAISTPEHQWVVGVSVPTDRALAPIEQSLRNTLSMFGAVVFLSVALALGLAELTVRPLGRLTRHADAFGRGELERKLEIGTGDELETLANTFNTMADAILAREEALRRSEVKYRNLVELTPDIIYVSDREGNQIFMNDAGFRLLEARADEVIAQPLSKWVHPDDRERTIQKFSEMLDQGRDVFGFENRYLSKTGKVTDVLHNVRVLRDEEGRIVGAQGVAHDISERKQTEGFREQYVSLVSHDLRNPVAVIVGLAQMLGRTLEQKGLEREARSAKTMLDSATRMNEMIQDLVESGRLEAGRVEMHRVPTDLSHLVSNIAERIGTAEDQARIRIEAPEWVPPVLADAMQIERALVNLVTNALKYSPSAAPVVIHVGRRDGEALVSVRDQGIGIPPGEQSRVFERFYRLKTGKRYEGLGLGLYITRLIVEAHGGRIWVESEPSNGSTFHFTLPLA